MVVIKTALPERGWTDRVVEHGDEQVDQQNVRDEDVEAKQQWNEPSSRHPAPGKRIFRNARRFALKIFEEELTVDLKVGPASGVCVWGGSCLCVCLCVCAGGLYVCRFTVCEGRHCIWGSEKLVL